jgi:hypothetical protein
MLSLSLLMSTSSVALESAYSDCRSALNSSPRGLPVRRALGISETSGPDDEEAHALRATTRSLP